MVPKYTTVAKQPDLNEPSKIKSRDVLCIHVVWPFSKPGLPVHFIILERINKSLGHVIYQSSVHFILISDVSFLINTKRPCT